MNRARDPYGRTVSEDRKTRFAKCGYQDRFDPFRLSRVPRVRALYEKLFNEYLGDGAVESLLDIGCGTGIYLEALGSHARRVDALDPSTAMLQVAKNFCEERGLGHVYTALGHAERLPYASATFDVVVALDALHHVVAPEKVVEEVYRVLKPGGRFMVFEPNVLNPLMWLAHALPRDERAALMRNRPASLRALLESRFDTIKWQGIAELVTETTGIRRNLLDAYTAVFRLLGCERIFPRQAWLGVKSR